jgi:FrmR/RcnR family transcriptional regulator, repressor of frmRAB operon
MAFRIAGLAQNGALELTYPFVLLFTSPLSKGLKLRFRTPIGWTNKMSHTSREKLDLVNRTKKVIGQLESVLRALNEDDPCADVLQRLSAARGAINSLMAELMEDHIRNHMPRNSKSSEEAADDVIQIVRTYLR